ncbi:hypothetical protein GJ496_001176, partial [Pomphorhynchus laevis]
MLLMLVASGMGLAMIHMAVHALLGHYPIKQSRPGLFRVGLGGGFSAVTDVRLGIVCITKIASGVVLSFYYSVRSMGGFWPVTGIIFIYYVAYYIGALRKRGCESGGIGNTSDDGGVFLGLSVALGEGVLLGLTVEISIVGAISLVADLVIQALCGDPTAEVHSLSRFFRLHYLLSLVVIVVVVVYFIELHLWLIGVLCLFCGGVDKGVV